MSDSGLLSHASVLKRDRKGDLRNGMVRMANPPPKATPESFCFLLFLLGVRRAYFGLGYQRDKGSKKLQVFTPQPTGMGSCPFQGWWDTWEHTQEPPDLSHMGPKEQQIPSLQPWGRAQGMALGGDSCWAGPGHRNPPPSVFLSIPFRAQLQQQLHQSLALSQGPLWRHTVCIKLRTLNKTL